MAGNVAQRFEEAARRYAQKRVLLSAEADDGGLDYATLDRRAGGVAAALAARGIGPGTRIALSLDDPADVVVAVVGGLKAGAAVAPLNPRLSAEERKRILDDLAPAFVLESLPDDEAVRPAAPVDDGDGERRLLRPAAEPVGNVHDAVTGTTRNRNGHSLSPRRGESQRRRAAGCARSPGLERRSAG